MRLFAGVPLPETLRGTLAALVAPLRDEARDLKWVDPKLYHLTLQFLGEVPAANQAALFEDLSRLHSRSPFVLRLGADCRLPPGKRARVLAVTVDEGFAELKALAADVMAVTRRHGVPQEDRPFRAHLTLARAQEGKHIPEALNLAREGAEAFPAWQVDAFHLFHSVLKPGGPVYTSLLRVGLDG